MEGQKNFKCMKVTIQVNGLMIYLIVAYDLKNMILLWALDFQIVKQSWNLEKSNHSHVLICHPEH